MTKPSDTSSALQELRSLSRALFGGAQYRLEVGRAIAVGDGLVCIKDLAEQLGDPPGSGSVNAELKILERAGLLARVPREKGERRVYLARQDSAYWSFCQELASRCQGG
jgi:DNA-binding MarR family transcriptional regulator